MAEEKWKEGSGAAAENSAVQEARRVAAQAGPIHGGRDHTLAGVTDKKVICRKCGLEMKAEKTFFDYLGHNFHTDLLRCPGCGEVFIPESLVRGRMAKVEQELEDK